MPVGEKVEVQINQESFYLVSECYIILLKVELLLYFAKYININ